MPPPYCYDYPRPAVTVDVAAFVRVDEGFRVLLIRRKSEPFEGAWAFPGGFVEIDEELDDAARRELQEETGLVFDDPLEPLGVWGAPGRDPRGRVISIVYAVALTVPAPTIEAADDAENAEWVDPLDRPELAFDHDDIISTAWQWLVNSLTKGPRGLAFLPRKFTKDDVHGLFRHLHVGPGRRNAAVQRFLDQHAARLPGEDGVYKAKPGMSPFRGKGRPRKGSRNPSREG